MPELTDHNDVELDRVTRLVRGLAHDFNNLLAIVSGNIQLARDRTKDGKTDTYLEEAEMATALAAELIQGLRSVAIDQPMRREHFAPAKIITAAMGTLKAAVGSTIAITFDEDTAAPPLFADPIALTSVLLNLVLNARDAMPKGGTIKISVAPTTMPDNPSRAAAKIAVQDAGIGMSPEVLKRALDPYFTTKSADSARGLGLAIVAGFTRQCKGHLTINSTMGEGTAVHLFLPAAIEEDVLKDHQGR